MAKLNEVAQAYQSSAMKNISVLAEFSTNLEVKEETRQDNDGNDYLVRFVEIENEQYRIPVTVIKQLKAVLLKKPDLVKISVSRTGTTKEDTVYTVIPLL